MDNKITGHKEKIMAIEKNEKLFRSLFDGAGMGIGLVDLNLNLFKVNSRLSRMLEYPEDELIQMSIEDLTYPEDLKKDLDLVSRLINHEIESYEIEKRYVTKSGKVFWGLLTVSGLLNENNEVGFLIGMIQDINKRKSAEERLAESERRFRAIFNSTFQFTGLLKPDGTLIEANDTALKFGGFSSEAVIGKPFWEARWWKISGQTQKTLQQAIKKAAAGDFIRYEVDVQGEGNKTATIDFSLKPVKDERGKVVLIIPEGRNITEKKIAEKAVAESEARFRLFVSQAPTAIAMLDNNLRYIAVSSRWIEDYKIPEQNLIGKSHYELFPEITDEWKTIHQEAVRGKVSRRLKDPFIRKDGTLQWLRWEVRPWYDGQGQIGGILMFTEDITDDVRNEEHILQLNRELEELNQQKIKLLSVIAHDMKAPIAQCTGLLDVVLLNQDTLTKEELLEYLKYLEKASQTVSDLIDELLLWARSQFNTLSFHPVRLNLSELTQKVLEQLRHTYENKGLTVLSGIEKDQTVYADPNLLGAVMRNLVSNAIKFTKPGGQIAINSHKEDNRTEVSVEDTGIGIKEENLGKLFDSSSHFTSFGTGGEKGTGLGLNLCKTFVEKHGGQISVKSRAGQGSTFTFTLPDVNIE